MGEETNAAFPPEQGERILERGEKAALRGGLFC